MSKTYDFKEELRKLNIKEQLLFVESYLPDAWEYLHDTAGVPLPTFDDNDEIVSWGLTPQDTSQDDKEDKHDLRGGCQ